MSRPVPLVAVLAVLLVASAVVPAVSVGAPPESVATAQRSDVPNSLACGFGAGSATLNDGDRNVSVTTLVAPESADGELENASAILAAMDAGRVTALGTDDPTVATSDLVIHRFELNGSATDLLDRLAARDRGSPTENFRALVREDGVEFAYHGPTACPPEMALNATVERGALRVVPDRENGALHVLLDLDEAAYYSRGGDTEIEDDHRWDRGHHSIRLSLRRSSGLVAENVTANAHYDADDPGATFEARTEGLVRLSAASDRTIRGHATVAPGSEIRVQLRPVEASTGQLNATATVNRSRGFAAEFDLSGVDDALYTVRVVGMKRDEDIRRTTLVAVGNATGAAVYAGVPESDGVALDDLSVATTDGGFAVVRNASGGVIGVSEYLDPGGASPKPDLRPPVRTNQTVSVTLYRDSNDDRAFDSADDPYRANGSVVRATTNVTTEDEPPAVSTTATTTESPASTRRNETAVTRTTAVPRISGVAPTKTTATSAPIPGFGPVVAVVALLGSLAVLGRRR